MQKSKYRRRRGDNGSYWISYSDMMAALLLVFILVLLSSLYQYFMMLKTKTDELTQKEDLLVVQQSTLDAKETELSAALQLQAEQQDKLNAQEQALAEQTGLLDATKLALAAQADDLALAQSELDDSQKQLADQQNRLDAMSLLLSAQKQQLEDQQTQLAALVGVRAEIIQELSLALKNANLKATVDSKTGDILLESTVLFELNSSQISTSGQALLDKFLPVYLQVLLQDKYKDYLSEIIIEGHTDTQGTYLTNLKLSQDRARSVATYCYETVNSQYRDKITKLMTANGKSFSNPIYNANGSINSDASRRVEFKFRLKDEEMIEEMRALLAGGEE